MIKRGFIIILFFISLTIVYLSASILGIAEGNVFDHIISNTVPKTNNLEIKDNLGIDLFSGATTYSYPITLPPGTNALQPQLRLFYSNQRAGQPGIVGHGWSITENYIQRDTNHTFSNTSDDEFILVINGASHNLIYVENESRYHTEIESFLHVKNETNAPNEKQDFWIVKTTDGTQYRFGFNNNSEALSNQYDYVWKWSLDLINDTYGNSIFYNYTENPYGGDIGVVYTDKIRYNNDKQREIKFIFESENRPDAWRGYQSGNELSQIKRLKEINITANGLIIRKYVLEYKTLEPEINSLSFISNITEFGNDEVSHLPPTKFEYEEAGVGWINKTDSWKYPLPCESGLVEGDTRCFIDTNHVDNGVRLADINGDGLVDILLAWNEKGTDTNIAETWLNNGTGWQQSNSWKYPLPCVSGLAEADTFCFIDGNHKDNGVRLADVNGDGYVDILLAWNQPGTDTNKAEIWLNNQTSGWDKSNTWKYPLPCESGLVEGDTRCFIDTNHVDNGVRLADVNGDNLVDILVAWKEQGTTTAIAQIYINNGTGWGNSTVWNYIPGCETDISDIRCFIDGQHFDQDLRLVDINGDGLTDIIRAFNEPADNNGISEIWLNNGTGWHNSTNWSYIPGCEEGAGNTDLRCFSDRNHRDQGIRFSDINGDGLTDIIRAWNEQGTDTNIAETWLNNGTGWQQSNSWKYPLPCVSGLAEADTFCFIDTDHTDNGVRLADINGDGLVDILLAWNEKGTLNNIAQIYINNGSKSYLLKNITTQFGGLISIDYTKSTHLNNTGDDEISDIGFNIWIVSDITEDNGVSGDHNTISTTHYNYSNGFFDYEDMEFRGFSFVEEQIDNKIITHRFHQDDSRKGLKFETQILDSQANQYKKMQRDWNSTSPDSYYIVELREKAELTYDKEIEPIIKNTSYTYDSFGNTLSIRHKGNVNNPGDDKYEYFNYLINTNTWVVNKVRNYSLFDSSNSIKLRETFYIYDDLNFGEIPTKGSITKKEDFLENNPNPITRFGYNQTTGNIINETDPNGHLIRYIYGINDNTDTYIEQIINAKEQISNFVYDLGTGNLLSETDTNNIPRNYSYDTFGRITNETLPLDSPEYPTTVYEYNFNGTAPEKIKLSRRETANTENTLYEYKFYDGFGKYIQTKKEAENSQQIIINIHYDNQTRIIKQSNPYFSDETEEYNLPDQTINSTKYYYDQLNRVINVTNPDGTNKDIIYNRWNITIYDENKNKKHYNTNAYGKITKVAETLNNIDYTTLYTYDAADILTNITDTLGNNVTYIYDTLGRKIRLDDPDLGVWSYSYDAAGNLIGQNDSTGNNLTIEYDKLNRKIKEVSLAFNRTYTYDSYLNSTLSSIEAASNLTINYTYDGRLRKIEGNKTIDNINFTTIWTYDSLDREASKTLPDGTVITKTYDSQGLLKSISGVIGNIAYNERNQISNVTYNNGLITNYSYQTDNLRLARIVTSSLQNLNYSYDNIGNVKEINDLANSKLYSMNYDDLDRLIYTNISDTASNKEDVLNFNYDEIGRMLNLTHNGGNLTFYYSSPPVHAPSDLSNEIVITSDANRFVIKDVAGGEVGWLGDGGNIVLKGGLLSQQANCNPPANSFIFNNSGYPVGYLDSGGNFCIEGSKLEGQADCSSPNDSFIVKNVSGVEVIVVDSTNGNLCLTGTLLEESDPSGLINYNLTYDGNGNLISGYGFNHSYNGFNRLVNTTDSSSGKLVVGYEYDHGGDRVKKVSYGSNGLNTTTYYIDDSFIQVSNSTGVFNESYYYLNDKLIAKNVSGKLTFNHPDHLGSTSLVTNSSGAIEEEEFYLPYGDILEGEEDSRFLYTGKEKDRDTDLYYYGARYYDPSVSRMFIQADSIILDIYNPQNLNRYSYTLNNPYKYTDTSGEYVETVLDSGFIAYDIYSIVQDPSNSDNYIALGLDVAGAALPFATGLGAGFKAAKGAAKAVDRIDDVADVAKAGEKVGDASKVARDPKVKSDFLKKEAQKPDALSKYGSEGVESMKQGKSPPGFQVHHKEPLYAGGQDASSNLQIVPQGLGPGQHPGTHSRGGETYNNYGPPQNYRGNSNQKTEKGFFEKIVDKLFGNRK